MPHSTLPNDDSEYLFVLLWHEVGTVETFGRESHFDLMLETDEALETWSFTQPLDQFPTQTADRLPDHRKRYLDYEGPISNQRGNVRRIDRGKLNWQKRQVKHVQLAVSGNTLIGEIELLRTENHSDDVTSWTIRFTPAKN